MTIPQTRMQRSLGRDVCAAIKVIGSAAERSGHACYLVGGSVRDLILNAPNLDIDIVSDGKITWIAEVVKNRSVKKVIRSQFSTVKVLFEKGFAFDIALARKETYPHPASLPVVQPGTLREDARRRDFTINTLLMGISQKDFGQVTDFCKGMDDLQKGIIRILHTRSFLDDPTRILRAFRFKCRFSFRFSWETATCITQAIARNYLKRLSPQRLRKELFLMLKEEKWDEMIKLLSRRRIFAQLGLPFPKNYKALNALKVCLRKHAMPVQSPELSKLLALTAHATQRELRRFGKRCGLRNNEVSLLQNVHRRKKSILAELSRSRSANSRIYELLEGISDEGLLYLFSVSSPRSARRISHYRIKLKSTRIRITGDDLKRLGIPQGPQFSKILRKILVLRLDGKLKSKKDELSFARKFAKD